MYGQLQVPCGYNLWHAYCPRDTVLQVVFVSSFSLQWHHRLLKLSAQRWEASVRPGQDWARLLFFILVLLGNPAPEPANRRLRALCGLYPVRYRDPQIQRGILNKLCSIVFSMPLFPVLKGWGSGCWLAPKEAWTPRAPNLATCARSTGANLGS